MHGALIYESTHTHTHAHTHTRTHTHTLSHSQTHRCAHTHTHNVFTQQTVLRKKYTLSCEQPPRHTNTANALRTVLFALSSVCGSSFGLSTSLAFPRSASLASAEGGEERERREQGRIRVFLYVHVCCITTYGWCCVVVVSFVVPFVHTHTVRRDPPH